MAELVERLIALLQTLMETLGYPGVFAASFAENIFPPIPSEIIMPFAGFVASQGTFSLAGMIAAGTAGTVVGALVIYALGAAVSEHAIRRGLRRWGSVIRLGESDLDRALALFDRHGGALVFFGQLIPFIRTVISLPAGMKRMPLGKFLVYTTLGSALWSALLAGVGYLLGDRWEDLIAWLRAYESAALGVLVLVLAAALALWLRRRHTTASPTAE